jgi:hypothetical protein
MNCALWLVECHSRMLFFMHGGVGVGVIWNMCES